MSNLNLPIATGVPIGRAKHPLRNCGPCDLCCTVLRVDATDRTDIEGFPKDEGIPCGHMCTDGGCDRYDDRPSECVTFHCGWLSGVGSVTYDRPDWSGWILTYEKDPNLKMHLVAYGTEEAFGRRPPATVRRELRRSVERAGKAVLAAPGRRRTFVDRATKGFRQHALAWCAKRGLEIQIYAGPEIDSYLRSTSHG